MSYLIKNKYKSLNLLFPLLNLKKDKTIFSKSYLYWNNTDETIDNYYLLVVIKGLKEDFKFEKYINDNIKNHPSLSNCYNTNEGMVYVFNFFDNRDVIDKFLEGKYSKFAENDKRKILNYYGCKLKKEEVTSVNTEGKPIYPHHIILYPENYYLDVADELSIDKKDLKSLYNSIKDNGELWEIFDSDIETLRCDILSECEIDYDKLTENL